MMDQLEKYPLFLLAWFEWFLQARLPFVSYLAMPSRFDESRGE